MTTGTVISVDSPSLYYLVLRVIPFYKRHLDIPCAQQLSCLRKVEDSERHNQNGYRKKHSSVRQEKGKRE